MIWILWWEEDNELIQKQSAALLVDRAIVLFFELKACPLSWDQVAICITDMAFFSFRKSKWDYMIVFFSSTNNLFEAFFSCSGSGRKDNTLSIICALWIHEVRFMLLVSFTCLIQLIFLSSVPSLICRDADHQQAHEVVFCDLNAPVNTREAAAKRTKEIRE